MINHNPTDDELLARIQSGEEEALGALIDRYSAYVQAIVRSIVSNKLSAQDAEEITSEAFFGLWKNAGSVRKGKVKAYLAHLARNRAIDAARRARPLLPLGETVTIPIDGPETEAVKRAEYAALKTAVEGLPHPDRELFIGRYYYAKPTRELAEEWSLPVNTVKTKLRRGREKLRRELENGGYYEKKDF